MAGENIIVTRQGKPVVRIDAFDSLPRRKSLIGLFEGQLHIPDDFDEWPEDVARAFGMIE
jgi:antitoxin (DNA-binding transcriptional repressor) of toxin-antitoxin stability system